MGMRSPHEATCQRSRPALSRTSPHALTRHALVQAPPSRRPERRVRDAAEHGFLGRGQEIDFATAEKCSASRIRHPHAHRRWSARTLEVVSDNTAKGSKALAQLEADPTDYRFPLAIYLPAMIADLQATTRFKPMSGKVDQAGGLAVRLADSNNYYLTRQMRSRITSSSSAS